MQITSELRCSLCFGPVEGFGHNPAPLADVEERCCTHCNNTKVIPARLGELYGSQTDIQMQDAIKWRLLRDFMQQQCREMDDPHGNDTGEDSRCPTGDDWNHAHGFMCELIYKKFGGS